MTYRVKVLHEAVRLYEKINKREISKLELRWLFDRLSKMPKYKNENKNSKGRG